MNCLLYARVSTEKQAEKELSIPAQIEAMKECAEREKWSIVGEFLEEGVSGKTTERPSLQRLLGTIRESTSKPDIVLVHKIDRVARNLYDYATIKAVLRQQGVRLVSVVEHVDDSSTGELIEHIMASFAEFYSANLSAEVKKGMRQKVMQGGWPHRPPRGYALIKSGETSVIEIHPKDGPLMKRGFELYATGLYSVQALTNRLRTDGLLSSTGGPVPQAHLRRLLENPFYVGTVRWHDEQRPGRHPHLIPQELFDKVQGVLRRRDTNPGPKGSAIPGFPLRGLAICASCRGRMTAERHGQYLYYRCSRQSYRRELCASKACNALRAHEGIAEACKRVRLDQGLADAIQIASVRLAAERSLARQHKQQNLEAEEAAVQSAETQLTDAFTKGDIAPNEYNNRVMELRRRKKVMTDLRQSGGHSTEQAIEHVGRILQVAKSLWDLYRDANDQRRTILLAQVFQTVVLDQAGLTGYTFREPFATLMQPSLTDASASAMAQEILAAAA